jgi:hypothetical protein
MVLARLSNSIQNSQRGSTSMLTHTTLLFWIKIVKLLYLLINTFVPFLVTRFFRFDIRR